jgi:hypothetical protein
MKDNVMSYLSAQLNDQGFVKAVCRTVEAPDCPHVQIETLDTALLGKKWDANAQEFIEAEGEAQP